MTTDRKLLEDAARAAGIEYGADRIDCGLSLTGKDGRHTSLPQWNPLLDDGDAFRLAVRLGMRIGPAGYVWLDGVGGYGEPRQSIAPDPVAATRRCIVRAAAAMGRKE